jgi:hypothetical protein
MRFADARLTTDEARLTFAAFSSVPDGQQSLQLMITTDKPR